MAQQTTQNGAIELEWTAEQLREMLVMSLSEDYDHDTIEAAVRAAMADEGNWVPVGETGRSFRIRPGLQRRLGIC